MMHIYLQQISRICFASTNALLAHRICFFHQQFFIRYCKEQLDQRHIGVDLNCVLLILQVACQAILLNQIGRAGFAIISITSVHARIGPKIARHSYTSAGLLRGCHPLHFLDGVPSQPFRLRKRQISSSFSG